MGSQHFPRLATQKVAISPHYLKGSSCPMVTLGEKKIQHDQIFCLSKSQEQNRKEQQWPLLIRLVPRNKPLSAWKTKRTRCQRANTNARKCRLSSKVPLGRSASALTSFLTSRGPGGEPSTLGYLSPWPSKTKQECLWLVLVWLIFCRFFVVVSYCGVVDQTQALMYFRQVLYHQAISLVQFFLTS